VKIFVRIIIGLAALLLIAYLFVAFAGPPLLKSAIEKKLAYYPDDSIAIGSLELEFFPLGLEMSEASFSFHQPGDSLIQKFTGNFSEIEARGIDWWRAFRQNTWEVGETEVEEGEFSYTVTNIRAADTAKQQSSGKAATLIIQDLKVSKLDLRLNRDSTRIKLQVSANADSLSFSGGKNAGWGYGRVALHSEDASYKQAGGDYDLSYQTLDLDSRTQTLEIVNLKVKPTISPSTWDKKHDYRKPLIENLSIPRITMKGFEFGRLRHGLFASKLLIDSVELKLYNNLGSARPLVEKKMPSEMIAKIRLPVKIDTVVAAHSSFSYRFVPKKKKASETARLFADQANLKVYPFSNINHTVAADLTIDYSMRIMKAGILQLKANYFADSPQHDFDLNVRLSPTSFAAFNPVVSPTLGLEFTSGQSDQLVASMSGNQYRSDGKINLAYQDLKVNFLEGNKDGLNLLEEVKEFGANSLLINSDNEMGENTGNIAFERPANMPFLSFWWRSLQSGLVPVLIRFRDNE